MITKIFKIKKIFPLRNNLKRKISFGIISVIITGIFLLPISPSLSLDGNKLFKINKNFIEATGPDTIAAQTSHASTDFTATVTASNITSGSVDVEINLKSTRDGAYWAYINNRIDAGASVRAKSRVQVQISDTSDFSNPTDYFHPTWKTLGYDESGTFSGNKIILGPTLENDKAGDSIVLKGIFGNLEPEKPYYMRFVMEDEEGKTVNISNPIAIFQTLELGTGGTVKETTKISNQGIWDFDCSLSGFSVSGCIANFVYVIFSLSAMVGELAAKFLDFFIYYSTNSDSYSNGFVEKGWSAIRDLANMFFIIALLYVAIKTILGLGVTDNKKIIGYVVIIALLLNFSLFFTQVIIDGSNILAKVFYNNITSVDENGKTLPAEVGGQKSISVGLVGLFKPQNLISKETYESEGGHGQFIFITILATAILLYMAYMFFAVALLFVGRVISLWLSMIFSPVAFASYTLPFDIPGFGHKEWWSELLKNAFLAPIFIFFLYIIVMFAGFLSEIVKYPDDADLMQKVMSTVIPFIILMVLLMKSKEITTKYAGEMGQMIIKGAQMIGGIVGGAALGAGALALRGTAGMGASYLSRSKLGANLITASEKKGLGGFAARMALRGTTSAAKGSFDIRKTALGGGLAKTTGMDFQSAKLIGLGSKAGGFEGVIERRNKKALEEFETHKTKMTNEEVEAWNRGKAEKDQLKDANGNLITKAEGLNNYRMKKFTENIGKTGLISSIAYSAVNTSKREKNREKQANKNYEIEKGKDREKAINEAKESATKTNGGRSLTNEKYEEIGIEAGKKYDASNKDAFIKKEIEDLLNKEAKNIKLGIGIGLAGVAGIAGAGIGAGMLGGGMLGGIAGGTIGAGSIGGEHMKQQESERLTRATMGYKMKILENIENRLKDLETTLETYQKVLEKERKENPGVFAVDGKIDKEKISKALAEIGVDKEDLAQQLKLLNKKIAKQGGILMENDKKNKEDLLGRNVVVMIKMDKLNELKGIEEKMTNTEQSMYNIGKDKTAATTPKKDDNHNNSKPTFTVPPPSTPPPAHN